MTRTRWFSDISRAPWIAIVLALLVLLPLLSLVWISWQTDLAQSLRHWQHLWAYVLPDALRNTVVLLLGVGVTALLLGTGSSWLVSAYDFPGRRSMTWALMLPLAVPTYIVAFAYMDLLHPIGPVQTLLREWMGFESPRQWRLPDIRGMVGAILLLGFVLYPYVYLSTRVVFMSQAAGLTEAALSLGTPRWRVFWRVVLPLARPAMAVGMSLVLLETLNDIGASEMLGVQTLTVSVYTTWITRSDLVSATQIALSTLAVVFGLLWLERRSRQQQSYATTRARPQQPVRLRGLRAVLALGLCLIPVILGFAAPLMYLVFETWKRLHEVGQISTMLRNSLFNTVQLAMCAALVTLVCGMLLSWAARGRKLGLRQWVAQACLRIGGLGYAVPGTVLAIGLLSPFNSLDRQLSEWLGSPRMWLMGSTLGLVLAYNIRFLAITSSQCETGLQRISPSLEQAARLLGESGWGSFRRMYLPLLRPSLAAATLLVFVDAMKELPATLLLRPLNFDTLATWLYAEAARGTYEEGAIAALAIVMAGLLPLILLTRSQSASNPC